MKKLFFAIIFSGLFFVSNSDAQVKSVTIGVDGFTCSLCAKGVEEQFKSLDFVSSVKADLKKTQFVVKFNSNKDIDISKIKNAVIDGGFSVRSVSITAKGTVNGNTLNVPKFKSMLLKNFDSENGNKVEVTGLLNSSLSEIIVSKHKNL